MMHSNILFLVRKVFPLIPDSRGYRFKRFLLRLGGVNVARNVRVCSSVKIIGDRNLSIGENTFIGHDTIIICSSDVCIGSIVNIAPRCYIGTGSHVIDLMGCSIAGKGKSEPIIIGNGAWLCASSTIIAGSVIGEMSIIAAGAVVKGKVRSRTMVGGVLAKEIKSY